MKETSSLRWGWIVSAAVLTGIAVFPIGFILTSLEGLLGIQQPVNAFDPMAWVLSPPSFFLAPIPFGYLAARKARSRFTLHGVLVGLIAALIFVPVLLLMPSLWGEMGPNYYLEALNSAAKIIGGGLGGILASRWSASRQDAAQQTHAARRDA